MGSVIAVEKAAISDLNNDGQADLQDRLLQYGVIKEDTKETKKINKLADLAMLNRMIVCTWPIFAIYLLTMPLIANTANNAWFGYSADYTVFHANGSEGKTYHRNVSGGGMCDTPASQMHCTDGQNFTELAIKYRKAPIGCGCGQGVLGEGLCPMTYYGYTLSDFVSTEPGIGAMLGLGFFPLLGTWFNTMTVNKLSLPSAFWDRLHMGSMFFFQLSYIMWGMASDCIFPDTHAILTVAFLGGFLFHWVITAALVIAKEGVKDFESVLISFVAYAAIGVISLGAIPRVFLTINSIAGTNLPNWNRGIGAYAFWFAEAGGLALTFGAYPLLIIGFHILPIEMVGMKKVNKHNAPIKDANGDFTYFIPSQYHIWEHESYDGRRKTSKL
jgi:hypothetical protein